MGVEFRWLVFLIWFWMFWPVIVTFIVSVIFGLTSRHMGSKRLKYFLLIASIISGIIILILLRIGPHYCLENNSDLFCEPGSMDYKEFTVTFLVLFTLSFLIMYFGVTIKNLLHKVRIL